MYYAKHGVVYSTDRDKPVFSAGEYETAEMLAEGIADMLNDETGTWNE